MTGQSAIVTGGASGVGEATARALPANSARVTIFDLNVERGEAVAAEIKGHFVRVDIINEESLGQAFASAREAPDVTEADIGARTSARYADLRAGTRPLESGGC